MNEASDQQRADRIAEIRRQIAQGTYETPARIEAAVEAMLCDEQFIGENSDSAADEPPVRRPR